VSDIVLMPVLWADASGDSLAGDTEKLVDM
jgi:hypothetical protein